MSHVVVDGNTNIKYVTSTGSGTNTDPYYLSSLQYWELSSIEGRAFFHRCRHSVSKNNALNHLLVTPTAPTQVVLRKVEFICTDAPAYIKISEGAIVSTNGTTEPLYNNLRTSSTSASSLLYLDPTITDEGVALENSLVFGDRNFGGAFTSFSHTLLKPSTKYLFQILNASGGVGYFSFGFQIEEH